MEFSIFLLGLIIGSFLNMLIYRLPKNISLLNPKRSICPNCDTTIKFYENIPVVSYLFLKGSCSNCSEKISITYPIVELLTAFLTLLVFLKVGFGYEFLLLAVLFYSLILLSFIDFKYKEVPDYLLIISLILAFIYVVLYAWKNIIMFFVFAGAIVMLELFVTYYIQNIKSKILNDETLKDQRAMGEGDVPIVAVIGGVLGLELGLLAIFLSAIFAIIPALVYKIKKQENTIPFIPFLTLGLFVVFIGDGYFLDLMQKVIYE